MLSKNSWDNIVSKFNVGAVPRKNVTQAQALMKRIDVKVTHQSSKAAYDLYTWVKHHYL